MRALWVDGDARESALAGICCAFVYELFLLVFHVYGARRGEGRGEERSGGKSGTRDEDAECEGCVFLRTRRDL